ncbi:MAG: LysM domain-containing protein [Solirubrobacteraceae bacterium]
MPAPRRRRRSPARWLAPLALLIVGVAVYSVVHRDSAGNGTPASTTSTARTTATTAQRSRRAKKAKSRTYTVKAGDTLSAIAGKTGVSLERIRELNPKLDSQALQTGETIKLGP